MKKTARISRINAMLDSHFKSNHGAWWVSNSNGYKEMIELHRGQGGDKINPIWIAKYIFRNEASVNIIHFAGCCMVYTRESVKLYDRAVKK